MQIERCVDSGRCLGGVEADAKCPCKYCSCIQNVSLAERGSNCQHRICGGLFTISVGRENICGDHACGA